MPKLTVQEVLDARNNSLQNMRNVLDRAKKEERNMTPAETSEYEGFKGEFEKWTTELNAAKKLESEEAFIRQQESNAGDPATRRRTNPNTGSQGGVQNNTPREVNWNPLREIEGARFTRYNERNFRYDNLGRGSAEYSQGFSSYLRSGDVRAFEALGIDPNLFIAKPYRAELNTAEPGGIRSDDDIRGGYLNTSETFMEGLLKNIDDQTWIYKLATNIIVRQSQALGIRCLTSKMSTWNWGAELDDALLNLDDGLRFGKRSLAPHYVAGSARISRDLIRMSVMDPEAIVYREFARDLAYVLEQAAVSGDGFQKPLGVLTASNDGIPTSRDFSHGTTGTTFTFETFIDAKYQLKPAYRNRARWMFNRAHISNIAQIRTDSGAGPGTGNFIWQPSMQVGSPDMLLGLPIDENEFFPTATGSGTYFGLLAVWEYYIFAVGLDMEIQKLVETRASKNQNEYIGRAKFDGQPVLAEAFARLKFA